MGLRSYGTLGIMNGTGLDTTQTTLGSNDVQVPPYIIGEGGKLHKGMHTKFKDDFIVKEYYADGELKRKSTKELKVAEMHEFLERVNQWSAEWGIRLPQPDERL